MTTFEYTDTFDYPAAAVFALLTDLEARPTWIAGILEVRVTPPEPACLGTSYFEAGKFSGFKSEKTLSVTEFEQDLTAPKVQEAQGAGKLAHHCRSKHVAIERQRASVVAHNEEVPQLHTCSREVIC